MNRAERRRIPKRQNKAMEVAGMCIANYIRELNELREPKDENLAKLNEDYDIIWQTALEENPMIKKDVFEKEWRIDNISKVEEITEKFGKTYLAPRNRPYIKPKGAEK